MVEKKNDRVEVILPLSTYQCVRAEFVIPLHVRKHIEDDATFNGCFYVVTTSIGSGLEHGLPHLGLLVTNATPLSKALKDGFLLPVLFGKGFGAIQQVWNVEILDVISRNNVRIACLLSEIK